MIGDELIKIVGAGNVSREQAKLDEYSSDISFVNSVRPECVVRPRNTDDVTKIVGPDIQRKACGVTQRDADQPVSAGAVADNVGYVVDVGMAARPICRTVTQLPPLLFQVWEARFRQSR